jgi:hypothetical protein
MPLIATTTLEWIWRNWKLVLGGLVVGVLGLMVMLKAGEARSWHKKADQSQSAWQVETAAHAVTRASLNSALSAIDDQNAAVQALASESADRIKSSEQARLAAQQAAQASLSTARALDASAAVARAKDGPCMPSETYLKHSGEL